MIHVADILDFLVSKSNVPSNFGVQLDRLKYGTQSASDPVRVRSEIEDALLDNAIIIRCLDKFRSRLDFTNRKEGYKILTKIQMHSNTLRNQGDISFGILQAYHEWCTGVANQERGLLEIYTYVTGIAPSIVPPPPKNKSDILLAFRNGEAKRARNFACEAYADALLSLQSHCRIWNKSNP